MNKPNYLPDVKTQYEHLPYPPVDPEDERKRLQRTWLEDLPMINHYCFRGQESFRNGFRVLVAGGGTGDATIFLAEQLKETDAEIVHLDLSEASIAIAMKRAAIRRLGNIRWVQGSLLDLPTLGLGEFDYINCVGVLHHLADPDAGLRALRGVLKARGALALMLYGAVGRTGVYHMQNLLRLANLGCSEADKIAQAKEVLAGLPHGNWYRLAGDLYGDHNNGDAGIYDSLLHSQDRAYTVPELMEWLVDGHGLHVTFSDVHRGRFPYLPEMTLPPAARQLRARLPGMALRERYAMSELLIGDLTRHNLYASATDATAPYGDTAYIPFYFHEPMDGRALEGIFGPKNGQLTIMRHEFLGLTVAVDAGKYSGKILRHVDGMRTFGEIFALVRSDPACASAAPSDAVLFDDFRQTYEALNAIERLLLRHASCR
jgi:ubiquinone/menaquinone biosynthesis C-methylase UbiE